MSSPLHPAASYFELRDLEHHYQLETIRRGLDYHVKGKVKKCELDNQSELSGLVGGSTERDYHVWLSLKAESNGRYRYHSTCNCPVGFQCKHGVALILAFVESQEKQAALTRSQQGAQLPVHLSEAVDIHDIPST